MSLKNCPVGALIAVADLNRARHFYEDQLGLVPGEVDAESVRYFCAQGTNLFVYLQPANAGMSAATIAGWTVANLDETMDELAARGTRFERYDQPGLTTDERGILDAGDFRAAWIKDPDGNTMALTQYTG
ncbi:VOC family protein [Solirubrobacter taibaiensis]|nr:VOC family protein [Solirubrobacter taibaiensis]